MPHQTETRSFAPVTEMKNLPNAEDLARLRPLAANLMREPIHYPFLRIVAVVGVMVAGTLLSVVAPFSIGRLIGAFAVAIAFYALNALEHDALHGSVSSNRVLNRVTGTAAALTILSCYSYYRAFHLEHHARTATPDDPEGNHTISTRWQVFLLPLVGVSFAVTQLLGSVGVLVGRNPAFVRTTAQRRSIRIDATILMMVVASVACASVISSQFRWLYLLPLGIYYLCVFPVSVYYEHFGAEGFELPSELRNQATITRSLDLWPPHAWLYSYGSCHTAHHLFPNLSADQLPVMDAELRKILPADLRCRGYTQFVIRQFRSLPWTEARASADAGR